MSIHKNNVSLLRFAQQRADLKRSIGKYATAELYEVTTRHFKQFLNGQSCRPADLTTTRVNDFAGYLQAKGTQA
ncbi:MAG: phage integrase SAM-like domain-containing protein [Parabacteroides sp.]|nr:phage integrase SAM-like domain-containing protein [Parabacteroides sp.]